MTLLRLKQLYLFNRFSPPKWDLSWILSRQAIKNRVNRAAKLAAMGEGVGSATYWRIARPNLTSYQRQASKHLLCTVDPKQKNMPQTVFGVREDFFRIRIISKTGSFFVSGCFFYLLIALLQNLITYACCLERMLPVLDPINQLVFYCWTGKGFFI